MNKINKYPCTIYKVLRCFIAMFTFIGTANWYQNVDKPTFYQRLYSWRIGPKTAWTLASGIWLNTYSKYKCHESPRNSK